MTSAYNTTGGTALNERLVYTTQLDVTAFYACLLYIMKLLGTDCYGCLVYKT